MLFNGFLVLSHSLPFHASKWCYSCSSLQYVLETFNSHMLLIDANLSNRKATKGSFIPGKGLREHESFNQLLASNPALETFQGRKYVQGEYLCCRTVASKLIDCVCFIRNAFVGIFAISFHSFGLFAHNNSLTPVGSIFLRTGRRKDSTFQAKASVHMNPSIS